MTDENPMECRRCGLPHAKCAGHNRQANPCGNHPLPGQRVCGNHGGRSPQALEAADRRLAERDALAAVESFGLPVTVDPHTALLEELHRTAGAVAWLGAIVADLDRGSIVWGVTEEVDQTSGEFPGVNTTSAAKPNLWYELWARERKHLVDVAAACAKAGIEERRVQLAEAQGQMLAAVIQRILGRLDLSDVQRALVGTVVPEELRAAAAVMPEVAS